MQNGTLKMVKETANEDLGARLRLAFSANFEISKLAETVTKIMSGSDDDIAVEGIMKRIQQLTEIVFFAQRLHGQTDEQCGAPSLEQLQHWYDGALLV